MPGLIKVGKTTTHPTQRMSELHSTGVPTPFELEFSAAVDNCEIKEKSSHKILQKYRVKDNREFFKISAKDAIEKILVVLGDYQIDFIKESYSIKEIKARIKKQEKQKLIEENFKKLTIEKIENERQEKIRQQIISIIEEINKEEETLNKLGLRPKKIEDPLLNSFLSGFYDPYRFGVVTFSGVLFIFVDQVIIGLLCVFLIFIGYHFYQEEKASEREYLEAIKPFSISEIKIKKMQIELEELYTKANSKLP